MITRTAPKPPTVVGETSYFDLDEAPLSRTLPTVLIALADAGVRVISASPHMGGFRLWVDPSDTDCARGALTEIKASYRPRTALLVETDDRPESLTEIIERLNEAGLALIEIRLLVSDSPALWALSTADPSAARAALC